MKTNYDYIIEEMLASEGGYVDHPSDPGGATKYGVTRKTLAAWRGVSPYTKLPKSEVQNLKLSEAKEIFRVKYWNQVNGDALPSGIDYAVFDYAVNSGVSRAVKLLQKLVGVPQDGILGPNTLNQVNAVNDLPTLINRYMDDRLTFLQGLSTFATFGKGWSSRVTKVRKLSLELVGSDTVSTPSQPKEKSSGLSALIPIAITLVTAFIGWLQTRNK